MLKLSLALVAVVVVSLSLGASCNKPIRLTITSPTHGSFHSGASVTVDGQLKNTNPANWVVTVNGVPVSTNASGFYSTTVSLDPVAVFNPILVEATNPTRNPLRQRVVVHAGDSRADGAFAEESVALRLNDSGLDEIEGLVTDLVDLDIATLLPPGTEIISNFCAIDGGFLGCLGRVDVSIVNPEPSFSSFGLDVDSMTNFAAGDVVVNDIRVDAYISGSGIAPSCGLRLTSSAVTIAGDYGLSPDAIDPSNIDVNLIGAPGVFFTNFNDEFTSGLCDFPLIGPLIQLIIGDIQPVVTSGLVGFLDDPDGAGPEDAPIAEGIETALAGISISGPIGQSLGAILETPLFSVDEDVDGITLGSDSSFVADCTPPAGAPDLLASYHIDEPFPTFGATSPGGLPYGLGMCVSTSAFNQLLKAQVECGLLLTSLTELSFPPSLPNPIPITAGLLALFVPQFGVLPPATAFRIDLVPTLAPIVTGQPGPAGEMGELKIAALSLEIVEIGTNQTVLAGAVDARMGLDLSFDDLTGSLVFGLSEPLPTDVSAAITLNNVGADIPTLETAVLPSVIAAVLPSLASNLGEFPLPEFLGLELQGVEVSRSGEFMSLFADLVPVP
jgi:hypothetical protein